MFYNICYLYACVQSYVCRSYVPMIEHLHNKLSKFWTLFSIQHTGQLIFKNCKCWTKYWITLISKIANQSENINIVESGIPLSSGDRSKEII